MDRQRKADMMLVLATGFWGVSNCLTAICLRELQPLTLNAFRFLTAFLVLGLAFRKRIARASRETLKYSLLVGLIFTLEPVFSAVFAFFLLGDPRLSRVMGYALHANPGPGVIPCHRVVKRDGEVSSAFAFGGAQMSSPRGAVLKFLTILRRKSSLTCRILLFTRLFMRGKSTKICHFLTEKGCFFYTGVL